MQMVGAPGSGLPSWGESPNCCVDECDPKSPPRIDNVDLSIIPANFSSPDQIDKYKDFVKSLHELHLVAGITPSSVLMTAVEAAYNSSTSDMHSAFDSALGIFSGNRAFVRLFMRVQFSTCMKKTCQIFRTRYAWGIDSSSPTGWKEYNVGMDPSYGYYGLQDAESHALDAIKVQADEFNSSYK